MTDPIPYAKRGPREGWIVRHSADAGTRMIAFAVMAAAGVGCRYLSTAVSGNADLYDAGKYMLLVACLGFVFEYVVSFLGGSGRAGP